MRDSGVEFLGEVPSHWSVQPVVTLARVLTSTVDKKSYEGEQAVKLCNYTDVYYSNEIVNSSDFMMATANAEQIAKFSVRAGDVPFTKDSETADDIGIPSYVPKDLADTVYGYHLSIYRPNDKPRGRFLKYLLDSNYAKAYFEARTPGVTRVGLGQPTIRYFRAPTPPLEEAVAIADYLDRETGQIDAFIAKNEELITLLTERRAAVIGRAVTRGLEEKADRLTEGPDWIGPVPAHWTVQPIKRGYSVVVGKMLNESLSVGELVPYVRAANIQPGGLDLGNVKEMRATAVECKALALRAGDVVFVEGGGGYGRSDFLSYDLPGWVFQNHVIRLRPRPGHEGRFLNYWLQHVRRLGHYEALSAFATIPNVSGDKLGRIEMPVPSLPEQREIVAHIEAVTSRIDDAIAVADRGVELARERRAVLISAAVTGKIDVGVAA